jgi:hypothetical protein
MACRASRRILLVQPDALPERRDIELNRLCMGAADILGEAGFLASFFGLAILISRLRYLSDCNDGSDAPEPERDKPCRSTASLAKDAGLETKRSGPCHQAIPTQKVVDSPCDTAEYRNGGQDHWPLGGRP